MTEAAAAATAAAEAKKEVTGEIKSEEASKVNEIKNRWNTIQKMIGDFQRDLGTAASATDASPALQHGEFIGRHKLAAMMEIGRAIATEWNMIHRVDVDGGFAYGSSVFYGDVLMKISITQPITNRVLF
jgi:hypothetical protein